MNLQCDELAISIAQNPILDDRIKHIEVEVDKYFKESLGTCLIYIPHVSPEQGFKYRAVQPETEGFYSFDKRPAPAHKNLAGGEGDRDQRLWRRTRSRIHDECDRKSTMESRSRIRRDRGYINIYKII